MHYVWKKKRLKQIDIENAKSALNPIMEKRRLLASVNPLVGFVVC